MLESIFLLMCFQVFACHDYFDGMDEKLCSNRAIISGRTVSNCTYFLPLSAYFFHLFALETKVVFCFWVCCLCCLSAVYCCAFKFGLMHWTRTISPWRPDSVLWAVFYFCGKNPFLQMELSFSTRLNSSELMSRTWVHHRQRLCPSHGNKCNVMKYARAYGLYTWVTCYLHKWSWLYSYLMSVVDNCRQKFCLLFALFVFAFEIRLCLIMTQLKPDVLCIPVQQYLSGRGSFLVEDLKPGNWRFRLRATSLAGSGPWTNFMEFYVDDSGLWILDFKDLCWLCE